MESATIYSASPSALAKSDISAIGCVKKVRTDGGLLKKSTFFDVELADRVIRLNVMPQSETQAHFREFKGYVQHLHQTDPLDNYDEIRGYIDSLQQAYGLATDRDFGFESDVFSVLNGIAESLSGVIFLCDSLIDTEGMVIFGPLGDA
ncbi:hypothetical protein [Adhaeretor mobilis]|uniref:Uncharacterized protein n=1 Tax=Adhaeretor mobilis TaxID=1930276 RepID=A0A517N0P2_9BACT|nr:hypothetical protein [Adhaeretor mobilis]QDT00674.1 hypothetical protein HG15A2_40130 [Adhaeretor mobilis]